jgi:ubiquinone/menaquinone biosynthesis C-methylase UbiE
MTPDVARQCIADRESEVLQHILQRYLRHEISPAIAIMRLLIHTQDIARVERLLDSVVERSSALSPSAEERQRAVEIRRLLLENRAGCSRMVQLLRDGMDFSVSGPSVEETITGLARMYNRAVQQSEEVSVAFYSLGNPELLQAATAEVIALMDAWGVLGPERIVLQIGCGIGRFEAVLASRVREAYGIDIAPGMVETALRRCRGLANVHIQACSGLDLALFGAGVFDLVYVIDTFPHLYQAGPSLVERHFAEVSRVLKPGGDFVILNFTYRGNPEADRQDIQDLARRHGFEVRVDGSYPLRLWDGQAWWLRSLHR